MKYRVRRLVAGVIATPLVAGLYFAFYAVLVGLGATPNATPSDVWNTGLFMGAVGTITLVFAKVVK